MKEMWPEDPYVPDYKFKAIESRTFILMGDNEGVGSRNMELDYFGLSRAVSTV